MSHGRDGIGVIFFGDKLFSVGGYDGHHYENIVEVYDPQTNEWSQVTKQYSSSFMKYFIPLLF